MKHNYTDYQISMPTQSEIDAAIVRGRRLHAQSVASAGGLMIKAVGKPFAYVAKRLERRRVAYRLESMSDRMLADIGVRRSDIWAFAGGTHPKVAVRELPTEADIVMLPTRDLDVPAPEHKIAA